MRNSLLIGVLIILLLGVGAYFYFQGQKTSTLSIPSYQTTPSSERAFPHQYSSEFEDPKKTPHYESNIPNHGDVIPAAPVNVIINFNFDLSTKSSISILKDGKEYGVGATTVDANKLTLRRKMDSSAPEGIYTVKYTACWPDGSCHDGSFQFAISHSIADSYADLRGKKEVTVKLSGLAFNPKNIVVSKGTKITWTNDEAVGHYVNSDPHAGHNYYPDLNSKLLNKGDSYLITLNSPGYYPYHCSVHADVMTGTIVVE